MIKLWLIFIPLLIFGVAWWISKGEPLFPTPEEIEDPAEGLPPA